MKYSKLAMGLALLAGSSAAAQPRQAEAGARVLERFERCRSLAGDAEQLACYRQATEQLTREVQGKELTILDRGDVKETRRSLFGFSLPKLRLFGGGKDDDPEFTEIDSTVARVRSLEYGKLSFTLPDNAVWQTTEPVKKRPSEGSKVTIKRAAMGSYFISFDGGRTVRGVRVN